MLSIILNYFNPVSIYSQSDSIDVRLRAGQAIVERFPYTRTINLEYEYLTPIDYRTKTHDKQLIEKGSLKNQNRIKLNLNIPFYKIKKWTFTASLRYRYNYFDMRDVKDAQPQYNSFTYDHTQEANTYNVGINSTYISRILGRPLIYNMSVIADMSQNGFERFTGMGIASVLLKKDKKVAFTAGLIVLIDPMIHYPVLPIIGLEYKLTNTWLLSLAMPQYAYLRKTFSKNSRLSFGTNITSDTYYLKYGDSRYSYRYNKAEIRTGFVYEHYIYDKLILTGRAGMLNALKGTLNRRSDSYNKYIMESHQNAGFYFNIGLSYNIF